MAISDSPVKSIALLVGIALIGTIFIVATATLRNRSGQEAPITSKPYSEPLSGIVFDAPAEWSVGMSSGNLLVVRGLRIDEIPAQRGSCASFSVSSSTSLQESVLASSPDAVTKWQQQLPGLIGVQLLTSSGGTPVLLGIDTCTQSLNQRLLTARGQTYRNDVEVRFSTEIPLAQSLSHADVEAQAEALAAGTATSNQAIYTQFAGLMKSVR